jgi:PAS domain S-box-containing protein
MAPERFLFSTVHDSASQPRLLSSLSQPVPPSLSLLVTEAQRRHEKKEAKKVANRRSASVSRARKKALVQEMTELNARLKRQALILALLPDLVVVVDAEGVITFCSSQVERVLSYAPDVLVGSKLTDLLVPSSRAKLLKLFKELVGSGGNLEPSCNEADFSNNKKRRRSIKALKDVSEESDLQDRSEDVKSNSAPSSKGKAGAEASDASFPMSVVNVDVDSKPEAEKQTSDDNEDNSDTSASRDSKRPSSLTNSVRSPIVDSGNSGSDDGDKKVKGKKAPGKKLPSSDTSNTSSSMDQANANLERNVRWHNKKLKSLQSDEDGFYKDDVIGAAVTANNASARLSSLRVLADRPEDRPEGSSSEEDDSGYRESNESREETSSTSTSDLTESNGMLVVGGKVVDLDVFGHSELTRFNPIRPS